MKYSVSVSVEHQHDHKSITLQKHILTTLEESTILQLVYKNFNFTLPCNVHIKWFYCAHCSQLYE